MRWVNWRTLLIAVAAFVGGFGGIYLGGLVLGRKNVVSQAAARQQYFEQRGHNILLEAGDLFPLEAYTDTNGVTGNFEQLLAGTPTVAVFLTLDCEPCFELAQFWQSELASRLKTGVQVVAVLKERVPPEFRALLAGMRIVYIDPQYWQQTYHLVTWPTIIGVDDSGFIVAIQETFPGYLDITLANYFLASQGSSP